MTEHIVFVRVHFLCFWYFPNNHQKHETELYDAPFQDLIQHSTLSAILLPGTLHLQ